MTHEPKRPSDSPPGSVFQFSLRDLLGLMAVASVILTTTVYFWSFVFFGVIGALGVVATMTFLYAFTNVEKPSMLSIVVVATLSYVGSCVLAPGYVDPGWCAYPSWCRNNVKQILIGLHNYHDAYGSFPPAYIADENGKPKHSWRVLILPFIEQQDLYDLYDFNEPWDGPNNRRLLTELPSVYCCPEQRRKNTSETNYVAVIGPSTAWPGGQSRKLADFADGTGTTLMVVEVVDSGIAWTAPQDLTFEEALKGLQEGGGRAVGAGHRMSGRLYAPTGGAALGYADGHVKNLWEDVTTEQWKALLQVADGKRVADVPMNEQQTTPAERSRRPRFQFDLTTLLLMPVFLAALGAIGVWVDWILAFALAPIPIGFLLARSRLVTWVEAGVIVALLGILIAILLPPVQSVNTSARRKQCADNIKQITLALHTYHDAYGSFPPAYVADEDGQPMHSWRVLILPFLGHQELYDQYDFGQPWDGPNNRGLILSIPPAVFSCPADMAAGPYDTSYVLVTGEDSAWPDDHAPNLDEFTDDRERTIVLVEVANSGIHWMEPRDLPLSEALRGINAKTGLGISSRHRGGAFSGRADGSAWFVSESLSREQLRGILTPSGGEVVEMPW